MLGQFVRAELLLGRRAMDVSSYVEALEHFESALKPPHILSEAKHLLSNQSDVYFWLGRACDALDRKEDAAGWYEKAVSQRGDFQQMSVRRISDMSFWNGLALQRLGRGDEASRLFMEIRSFAETLDSTPPKIDYFATSLPTMLLFEDDLAKGTHTDAAFLKAQALFGLGAVSEADELLHFILEQDANHAGARDLLAMQHLLCEKTGRH